MNQQIKILHIAPDFTVTYFICHSGSCSQFTVTIKEAVNLLKTEEFDLILSEPHNRAILNHQSPEGI
jgi:hypothetical protein